MTRHLRVVGVDVTAHKEERNVADTRKKLKLRVRYYVELVVGPARARHTRLGFSGSFRALMGLHQLFLRAYMDKYSDSLQHADNQMGVRTSLSSSTSSTTSTSRSSLSSPRGVKKLVNNFRLKNRMASEPTLHTSSAKTLSRSNTDVVLPYVPSFPASNKLLVHLETGEAKDDAKIAARTQALFEYYTQLFNAEDCELFLDVIQQRSLEYTERSNSQCEHDAAVDAPQSTKSGGLFKFLARHSSAKHINQDKTKQLEFLAPVQVSSSGKVRALKSSHLHTKNRRESMASQAS
ncbi:hypothetical protein FI667_g10608, partial [Globisporangium splendens]